MRVGLVAVLMCSACDAVFGLSGDPGPCGDGTFSTSMPTAIATADDFAMSWDRSLAIIQFHGSMFELHVPGGDPTPIDLGIYPSVGFSLAPEGTSLFYTAAIEPPILQGAHREGVAAWQIDTVVPRGEFAGTPSAEEFGPRRVLVRMRDAQPDVQEYEDDHGVWTAVGDPSKIPGGFAPNLTPNGLTMVFDAIDPATGEAAVFSASRAAMSDAFGDPVVILPGPHRAPLLLDACHELYVVDGESLDRYAR